MTIQLTGESLNGDLLTLSEHLSAEGNYGNEYSNIRFENNHGTGKISIIRVSESISIVVFDVVFVDEVEIIYTKSDEEALDLFFCLEGSVLHRFGHKSKFQRINFRQNSIVKGGKTTCNTLQFIPNTPLKMSIICYNPMEIIKGTDSESRYLRHMASQSIKSLKGQNNFIYLGRICFRTSKFINEMMSYSMEITTDIIYKEAAILNTLASQLERYYKDSHGAYAEAPIKQYEIDKIIAVQNFIDNNLTESLTVESLERLSGLGAAKLQAGFKYLFEDSVSSFITQRRLEKGAELLENTELSISEIVYSIGFSSRSYFSKIFKKRYGISPSQGIRKMDVVTFSNTIS